jgi:signal transduction histidine kinase
LKPSALLEVIVRNAPDGIVVCDAQGRIVLANAAAKRLAQMDPEGQLLKFPRRIWGEMFDTNGRVPAEAWPWMRALGGETTTGKECRLIRSDGITHDILFSAVPVRIRSEAIAAIVATLVEITPLKRAELVLREQAVCRGRGRIAADIHDTPSQGLSAIVLQLQAAEEEFPNRLENVQQHLRRAREVARESLAQVRRSMWTLSDNLLDHEDLGLSLLLLAKQLFATTRVELEFSVHGEARALLSETRLALLRIAGEALVNVLKHAQATTVYIRLTYERGWLQVRVEDNGRGFASCLSSTGGSFGLIGMRKRAECLGGRVVVTSQPGVGTRVVARIPLSSAATQRAAA